MKSEESKCKKANRQEHKKSWQETCATVEEIKAMGFESKLVHGVRRYRVVRRTEAEKELHRHLQEMGGEGGEVE
jgi:hypothetical protein